MPVPGSGDPRHPARGFQGFLGRAVHDQDVRNVPELLVPSGSLDRAGWISFTASHSIGTSTGDLHLLNYQTKHNHPAWFWPLRNLTLCNNKEGVTPTVLPCLNTESTPNRHPGNTNYRSSTNKDLSSTEMQSMSISTTAFGTNILLRTSLDITLPTDPNCAARP